MCECMHMRTHTHKHIHTLLQKTVQVPFMSLHPSLCTPCKYLQFSASGIFFSWPWEDPWLSSSPSWKHQKNKKPSTSSDGKLVDKALSLLALLGRLLSSTFYALSQDPSRTELWLASVAASHWHMCPFAISLPHFPPLLPGIPHVNYVHSKPFFDICFWGNPTKTQT